MQELHIPPSLAVLGFVAVVQHQRSHWAITDQSLQLFPNAMVACDLREKRIIAKAPFAPLEELRYQRFLELPPRLPTERGYRLVRRRGGRSPAHCADEVGPPIRALESETIGEPQLRIGKCLSPRMRIMINVECIV